MIERIFINGLSLVSFNKSTLTARIDTLRCLSQLVMSAKKLKVECYCNYLDLTYFLQHCEIVTIQFNCKGNTYIGQFVTESFSISKKGYISFTAESSGHITITAITGE